MKNIKTFNSFVNESYFKKNNSLTDPKEMPKPSEFLKPGKVLRVVKDFNASDLPWEKYANSFIGKIKMFNINKEGDQLYKEEQPMLINNDNKFYAKSFGITREPSTKYVYLYPNNLDWINDNWFTKMVYMAYKEAYIKIDEINDIDKICILNSDIKEAISKRSQNKVLIDGIEVVKYDDYEFDYNKGYAKVEGFDSNGNRVEKLIRNLLDSKIEL